MRYKTNSRDLKDGCIAIIEVGYCELQELLRHKSPVAYNSGTYGWNYDVYDAGNDVAIVTGYRGMPHKNAYADYATIKKYEDMAKGKTREERDQLIQEFVKECVGKKYR